MRSFICATNVVFWREERMVLFAAVTIGLEVRLVTKIQFPVSILQILASKFHSFPFS